MTHLSPLVQVRNLSKRFGKQTVVFPLNFTIYRGETLGLVGESGSGKTTTGKMLLRLEEPTTGSVEFDNKDLYSLKTKELKTMRRHMQMIFQDPYASLNPRMNVEDIVGEGLEIHGLAHGIEKRERVAHLLQLVGLNASHVKRYPHEFSGGQRQRIGIARVLAIEPKFIVCDEPLSALDISIQAQIVNLLKDLRDSLNLTLLFIAHDLAMVRYLSDRVAVMNGGYIVEMAPTELLFQNPQHPYTQLLLASIPIPDPKLAKKMLPHIKVAPLQKNSGGCPFAHRCPKASAVCHEWMPSLEERTPGHFVACYHHL